MVSHRAASRLLVGSAHAMPQTNTQRSPHASFAFRHTAQTAQLLKSSSAQCLERSAPTPQSSCALK